MKMKKIRSQYIVDDGLIWNWNRATCNSKAVRHFLQKFKNFFADLSKTAYKRLDIKIDFECRIFPKHLTTFQVILQPASGADAEISRWDIGLRLYITETLQHAEVIFSQPTSPTYSPAAHPRVTLQTRFHSEFRIFTAFIVCRKLTNLLVLFQ
jgi:hypothetical protein